MWLVLKRFACQDGRAQLPCDCELAWHVRLKAMVALEGLSGRNATRRGFACVLAVFDRKAFGPAIREWPARRRAASAWLRCFRCCWLLGFAGAR